MTSQMPSQLDNGTEFSSPQETMRLGRASFWLSLSLIVLNGPGILGIVSFEIPGLPPEVSSLVNSSPFLIISLALLLLSHITSISAIVTGLRALTQAGQYPSPKPRMILAEWGVALGFVGIVLLCGLDLFALAIISCDGGC